MGIYNSPSQEAATLTGLHLYQFGPSNCSQRVRLALEEKGLSWTTHTLNATNREHLSRAYQEINPHRVVPALVHDGRVVIESNDIITYIDDSFPEPPLRPADQSARVALKSMLDESTAFQLVIKTLSHEILFRKVRQITAEDFDTFREIQLEPERIEFYEDFMENGAAWAARMDDAKSLMHGSLDHLENVLSGQNWLTGDAYGLVDISWIVNVYRLMMAKLPVSQYAHVEVWANRVIDRPAFDKAVASYRA